MTNCLSCQGPCFPVWCQSVLFVTLCQWFSCPCPCLPVSSRVFLYVSCFVTLCQWFPCPCPFLPVCSKVTLYVSCLCCRLFSCLCPCLLSVPTSSYMYKYVSSFLLSGGRFPVLVHVSLFLPPCQSDLLSLYLFPVLPSLSVFPASVFNCLPDCPLCPPTVFHV